MSPPIPTKATAAECRAKAAKCRFLASHMDDKGLAKQMAELGEHYEDTARELDLALS
jgi:hypothetical protein